MKETRAEDVLLQHHVEQLLRQHPSDSGFAVLITEAIEGVESEHEQLPPATSVLWNLD